MNKQIFVACIVGLYAPCITANFPRAAAAAGAGQGVMQYRPTNVAAGAAQQATSSPLAKLHAKQSSENKLVPWQSIIASLLPLKLVPSKMLRHDGIVRSVAWNSAGTHLATGCDDKTARIWNANTDQQLHTLQHQNWVCAVAWNHAGTHLATGSVDKTARIWNANTGQKIRTLQHQNWVYTVAWNPAGTHLATGSADKTARIWDANAGQQLHTLQHQNWVYTVAWNPAGTQLAAGSDDYTARIWDANAGQQLHTLQHSGTVYTVAWNPAGTHLATGSADKTARIWDANAGQQLHTLQHHSGVCAVAWNPAGTRLATGSQDKTARIWDANAGQQLHTLQHQGEVFTVAWNHDGTHLATGSYDKTARIWDTTHLADPKYHAEYDQLKSGALTPEQLMLIHLLHRFRQQQKIEKEISLKTVAHYAQTKGITTAELAGVLLTLHSVIMNGILAHYNVSVQRENIEQECEYKALQEAMEPIKACHEAIKKTHEQNAAPLRTPQVIKAALEEYLVDTENYLDAYKAWRQTQQVVPLLKPVNHVLEGYIVEEHPKIEEVK